MTAAAQPSLLDLREEFSSPLPPEWSRLATTLQKRASLFREDAERLAGDPEPMTAQDVYLAVADVLSALAQDVAKEVTP